MRSKNAGPFEITLDIVFKTKEDFEAVKKSGVITKELVSELYNVPTQTIITFGFFDLVNAVKITLPRPRAQGGIGETDMHAAQQHVPLQEIRVPWPRAMIGRRSLLGTAAALGLAGRASAEAWPRGRSSSWRRSRRAAARTSPAGWSPRRCRRGSARPCSSTTSRAPAAISAPRPPSSQPPDGYTYLTISGSYAINSLLHKPSFDSLNDIVAIGQFTDEPTVLCVNPAVPAKTLKELVELATRARQARLRLERPGRPGPSRHRVLPRRRRHQGDTRALPRHGAALNDLLAGNVQLLTGGTTTMLPYIKNGQVRPLAISTKIAAADIPTFGEQGYPTLDFNLWHGMIGPREFPARSWRA